MTYLPPDPALGGPPQSAAAPKAAASSALQGPRTPVTRWNRRYLLAGGMALAAVVALAFYLGFGGANRAGSKAGANPPAADTTPTTPALADRYPKGYGDLTPTAAGAPGSLSLPAPATNPAAVAPPPPRPVDPAVQQAQAQAQAARTASPFFQPNGAGEATPAPPLAALPPTILAAAAPPTTPAASAAPADVQPANGQGAKRTFVQTAKADDYLIPTIQRSDSLWGFPWRRGRESMMPH